MTLWRRTRNEVAGAWRSLRYDLGRREAESAGRPAGVFPARRDPYQDVTATGFSTFGGVGLTGGVPSYVEVPTRRPRRVVAAAAFGVLAVAGGTGSYFAVVNGLGALLGEPGAAPYPLAAAAPGTDGGEESNEGLGRGSGTAQAPAPQATGGTIRVLPNPAATTAAPAAPAPRPGRTTAGGGVPAPTQPQEPSCCLAPPVPTPTAAPTPTSHSPSPTPEPSETTAPPSPEPTDSPSSPSSSHSGDGEGDGGGRPERARHARAD
ncbi:hypothetical protein [Actinoplanes sp. NPDC051859]|uniref:hypothetical protein n=1 Tax=Actinoplanes sp. NPDC051859 TaxID=3363909 RepID=UPI0037B666A1